MEIGLVMSKLSLIMLSLCAVGTNRLKFKFSAENACRYCFKIQNEVKTTNLFNS